MILNAELRRNIISFLQSLPNINSEDGRLALIESAVLDEKLTAQIPVHTKGEAYGVKNENGVFGGWRRPFLKNPLMHTRGNQLFFSTTAGKVKEKKNLIPNSEPDTAHSLRLHLVAFIIWSRLGIISLLV